MYTVNKARFQIRTVVAGVLLSAILAGCAAGSHPALPGPTPSPSATPTPNSLASSGPQKQEGLGAWESSLEAIYRQLDPSVVNIRVVQQVQATGSLLPGLPAIPGFTLPLPQQPQSRAALGSGFVWDTQGHIITNNHVVDGASDITVTFSDGSTASATVVGSDPDSDLAVLQVHVSADRLHPVVLADSSAVTVGQLAVAIGNPFGLQGTMTVGIVSGLGRTLPADSSQTSGPTYTIPAIIQTDAPINPGNSGGVLADDQGQVVGVTSAIVSPVDASAGIGFAIPSVIVQQVVPALISQGHYDHPYIGISGTDLTPALASAMHLPENQQGLLVIDVASGGPAEHAGLLGSGQTATIEGQETPVGGDVVTAIDGNPIRSFDDLAAYLALDTHVGQTVTLDVLRGRDTTQFPVTLTARPASAQVAANPAATRLTKRAFLGIVGVTLTPDLARAMDLSPDQTGVLVEEIANGGPADLAGMRGSYKPAQIQGSEVLVGGDVITAIQQHAVASLDDLQQILGQLRPRETVPVAILRDGRPETIRVTLGDQAS
jgi:S1-C subfamily serine protease